MKRIASAGVAAILAMSTLAAMTAPVLAAGSGTGFAGRWATIDCAQTWSYLKGPSGSRDPGRYVRLTDFDSGARDAWVDPASTLAIGQPQGVDRLVLHPASGEAAILAWRSPYQVSVTVVGAVEVDAACGDGVVFWIDRGGDSVETLTVPIGTRPFGRALTVDVGETLYFGVDAASAGSADCDLTWLRLTISGS